MMENNTHKTFFSNTVYMSFSWISLENLLIRGICVILQIWTPLCSIGGLLWQQGVKKRPGTSLVNTLYYSLSVKSWANIEVFNPCCSSCLLILLIILIFFQARGHAGCDQFEKSIGNLLYNVATRLKAQILHHRPLLVKYVATKKVASEQQLTGKAMLCPSERPRSSFFLWCNTVSRLVCKTVQSLAVTGPGNPASLLPVFVMTFEYHCLNLFSQLGIFNNHQAIVDLNVSVESQKKQNEQDRVLQSIYHHATCLRQA